MKKNIAKFIELSYEKLKLLKRSDKGEVWLANTRANDELVIIKHVNLTGLPYGVIKNSSFRLPAKVFFCAEDDRDTVVVEEFIHGENMLERLEQKKFLTEEDARKILLQLCDGLKELHEQNIIHRDIKPSNLILQGERIRLIDFDAARIFKSGKEADTKLLGTRGYAPPEQYGSNQTDPRSDIYSLGVTLKTLLGDNCGGRLKKILDKCTEYDPAHRYQSTKELKRDILLIGHFSTIKKFLAAFFGMIIFFFTNNSPVEAPQHNEEIFKPAEPVKNPEPAEPTEIPQAAEVPEYIEPPEIYEPVENPQPEETFEPAETTEPAEIPQAPEILEPAESEENPPTLSEFKPSFSEKAPTSIEEFTPSFPSKPTFNPPVSNSDIKKN